MTDRRAGLALVGAVAVLVAATLLAHAALLLAQFETAAGRAGLAALRARTAAASALASIDALPSGDSVPVGGRTDGPRASTATGAAVTRFDRIGDEIWLVRAHGRGEGGAARALDARLFRRLDPIARVAAFRAVVEVGPDARVRGRARVAADAFLRAEGHGGAVACRTVRERLASRMTRPVPTVVVAVPDSATLPGLGWIDGTDLAARLPVLPASRGRPEPLTQGARCTPGPWNWGDPGGGGPCTARFVSARVPTDLVVTGGTGQGLLVVPGDLTLEGGAVFQGVALVGGVLLLRDGSRLVGLARARGGLDVDGASLVAGAACPAAEALAAARLDTPEVVPGGAHLGPLEPAPR